MILTELEKQDIKRIVSLPFAWNQLRNTTVLVSGGSGFIGSWLIAVLEARNKYFDDKIKIFSLSRHKHENSEWVKHIVCDVSKPIEFDKTVDYVIHLASNTHPIQYAADPVGTIITNVFGCNNLLLLAKEKKAKRFLLASSVEIYGNGTAEPMSESYCGYIDCNTSRAGYNESKRVSESLCQAFCEQFGVNCVIARLARVFGADNKQDTKAIAQFMRKAICDEDIVLKSNGNQRFSFCYIADAISGLLKLLLDGKSGEAYNISDDDECKKLCDYAKLIADLAKRKVVYAIENDDGASKADYALLDCTKLKALDWRPLYTVSKGLCRTFEIYKNTII